MGSLFVNSVQEIVKRGKKKGRVNRGTCSRWEKVNQIHIKGKPLADFLKLHCCDGSKVAKEEYEECKNC